MSVGRKYLRDVLVYESARATNSFEAVWKCFMTRGTRFIYLWVAQHAVPREDCLAGPDANRASVCDMRLAWSRRKPALMEQGLCNHFTVLVQAVLGSLVPARMLANPADGRAQAFHNELLRLFASEAKPLYLYSPTFGVSTCRSATAVQWPECKQVYLQFEVGGENAVATLEHEQPTLEPLVLWPGHRALKWRALCLDSVVLARVKRLHETGRLPRDIYDMVADYAFGINVDLMPVRWRTHVHARGTHPWHGYALQTKF